MSNLVPIDWFVEFLKESAKRKDGYIMGSYGQDPKKWSKTSYYFDQYTKSPYTSKQHEKALYWREHAARVFDCNGLAEGAYQDYTGININSKARYNYADWCGEKGSGMIPANKRKPGMAIFWGEKASNIHHVAYLIEPVDPKHPELDWVICEARGVMYGVVFTKQLSRKPNFWGEMSKYFDYTHKEAHVKEPEPEVILPFGGRTLKKGMKGEDVKQLQEKLIALGFNCGSYGADGDFGSATQSSVKEFQKVYGLTADGVVGEQTVAKINGLLEPNKIIMITGGSVYVRSEPNKESKSLGIVRKGEILTYAGSETDNWFSIKYKGYTAWVSKKYSENA